MVNKYAVVVTEFKANTEIDRIVEQYMQNQKATA